MPRLTDAALDSRRQMILAAAMACFARDGFHRTTMADIAAEAGVSDGLAYRYFAGKDDIIRAVVSEELGAAADVEHPSAVLDDAGAVVELITRVSFRRFGLAGRADRVAIRLRSWAEALDDDDVRAEVRARWHRYLDIEARSMARAQEQGLIPSDVDPEALARVSSAIHDGLDLQWRLDGDLDLDAIEVAAMALVRGLRPCPDRKTDPARTDPPTGAAPGD